MIVIEKPRRTRLYDSASNVVYDSEISDQSFHRFMRDAGYSEIRAVFDFGEVSWSGRAVFCVDGSIEYHLDDSRCA